MRQTFAALFAATLLALGSHTLIASVGDEASVHAKGGFEWEGKIDHP